MLRAAFAGEAQASDFVLNAVDLSATFPDAAAHLVTAITLDVDGRVARIWSVLATRKLVALSGDYDFQFMIEELAVGAQFKLPYIHMVVNNSYLGLIRQAQRGFSMDYCVQLAFDNQNVEDEALKAELLAELEETAGAMPLVPCRSLLDTTGSSASSAVCR